MSRTVVHVEKMELVGSCEAESATGRAFYAMVDSLSPDVEEKLWDACQWNDEVTLRYSTIDVHGLIRKVRYAGVGKAYFLEIEGIEYQTSVGRARNCPDT